jgi:hypothetical protein
MKMTAHDIDGFQAAHAAQPVFHDDFQAGFRSGGPDAAWQIRPAAGHDEGDGVVTAGQDGFVVTPRDTDPTTGEPCFADTGDAHVHVRWAGLVNRTSPHGFPGFASEDGKWLILESEFAVRAYGLDRHPYGDDVKDPGSDLRLAAAAMITTDRETGLVFDFMVTDRCVYAVYERLGPPDSPTAAFSYAVPVADRGPDRFHRCVVAYHRETGVVRWILDGRSVLTVDRIGLRALDVAHLTRDNGRPAESAAPRQLTVGLGLFADRSWGQGVRLAVRHVTVARG